MDWPVITLVMLGKFSITLSFQLLYLMSAEMYPTTIRNVAIGSCNFVSRVGGIAGSFIVELVGTISANIRTVHHYIMHCCVDYTSHIATDRNNNFAVEV